MREPRRLQQTTQKVRGGNWKSQAATVQEQPRGAIPRPRSGAAEEGSYLMSEVRSSGQEEQPHVHGTAAVRAQEGQEELLHVQGQEG